jgi:hypothetical protein
MVTDSTNGTGGTPVTSSDADAASSDSAAGPRTQIAQGDTQPVIVARQIAQAGDQAPLLAMLPQAGEWVIIKVEPGSAVQLPIDLAQFTGHEVNGNLELTLPNGGVVVLEGFVAAANSGTPPELLTAEGKPIDLAEFLVAVGVAPEALHVATHEAAHPTPDHGGHFTDGPGPQILGALNPIGAIEATELLFPAEAVIKEEVNDLIKKEPAPPSEPRDLQFSVTDATVTEGQVAVFTVSYTGDTLTTGQTATIHVATGPGFTGAFADATPGADYNTVGIDLTFTGGQPPSLTVGVSTIDDTVVEGPEDYTLVLSSPSTGTIIHSPGNGVILDNDGSNLHWSIVADSTVTEGSAVTYTVGYTGATLATGITETITVATGNGWTTGFSDATAGADYTAINTVVTFTGGQPATQTISVGTINDTIVEGPEDYTIGISGASAGSITQPQANGVILDDNDGSRLNWSIINDTTVTEGSPATYTVGYTGATLAPGVAETQDLYLDDQRKITEQTRVSWNSVTTSHENVIELQKTVVANTQTRDAYIQQFDIGQRGLLDLLNEDNELYLSKDNLVTATFAEVFARFRLLAVAGGLEKALSVSPPEQAALPVEQ